MHVNNLQTRSPPNLKYHSVSLQTILKLPCNLAVVSFGPGVRQTGAGRRYKVNRTRITR